LRTQVILPAGLESTTSARRFAEETLHRWGIDGEAFETVRLLVSELVANAVTHAATRAELVLDVDDRRLRVEVRDEGGGSPRRRDPSFEEPTGRGLLIVEELADRWGVDDDPPGKSVWFELGADRL
jgi:anti-sigma regulatory factor (Ser/Thr protein kinase)